MGIGEHFEGVKQHWASNFAFLDYFKKVYGRAEPLPKWSDADVNEFIASDPVYGPQVGDPIRSPSPSSSPRLASPLTTDAVSAAQGPAGVEEVRARRRPRRCRPPRRRRAQVLQGAARYDRRGSFAAMCGCQVFQIGCDIGLVLLLLLIGGICGWVAVIDCRRPAGDRVRGDHRRRAGIRGGGALVPALQDGQAGGQP